MKMKALIFAVATMIPTGILAEEFHWKSSVGMMILYGPKYDGSSEMQPFYMPEVNFQYGPFYTSVSQGVGVYVPLNEARTFIISPAIRWRPMRNLGEAYGVIDYILHIRPTATLNAILKLDPFMINVRATTGVVGDNKGANYNLGLTWTDNLLSDKLNLTIYATAIYGDKAYNQTYFGITHSQSADYGFDVHNASAGLKSVDIGGLMKYFITPHISIDFLAEYLRLVGPAAKSPITLEKNQLLFGIGVSYKF